MDMMPIPSAAGARVEWGDAAYRAGWPDPAEQLAGYGRWWLDRSTGQILLSSAAGRCLGVEAGVYANARACGIHVVQDDLPLVEEALARVIGDGSAVDVVLRIIDSIDGLRWLRVLSAPTRIDGEVAGVLVDITSARQADMREKFQIALTQFLIGTDTLADAVTRIIRLVCEDLGWEWGAYWAVGQDAAGTELLQCRHWWHAQEHALGSFQAGSVAMQMPTSDGVVGRVWSSGKPEWYDCAAPTSHFVRGAVAAECGLRSGYIFPVTYSTEDGHVHRPGVLEFFSTLPRQREAQLPNLSASIGGLIAMTAQRMVQQERIRHLALTDELTSLANRNHFHSLVDAACARPARAAFGVLYIDLDQFKPINDAFGHQAGNVVLAEFARRLRAIAPTGCAVGRLGGDEFAILANPELALADLNGLAAQVLQAAREPFSYDSHELSVSASIGISRFPADGSCTAELLHAADAAMYASKRDGRNLSSHYRDDGHRQQVQLAEQLTLLSELHHAHEQNQFILEYQPIFDSCNGRLMAVEALIRWRRPSGELVPPDVFIPIAEKSRLIVRLGRWVAAQACLDLPLLHAAGLEHVQVHINMAAPEFIDAELPGELMAVVTKAGIAPHHICLELTESVVMSHPDKSVVIMNELCRLGFSISLDDFGMGYSSLSMLKKLPIASFKIDREFLAGVPHQRADCAIVQAMLDLGRHMKSGVIVEGVETDAQLSYLRQYACQVQGYLLGRPMAMSKLIALHGVVPPC